MAQTLVNDILKIFNKEDRQNFFMLQIQLMNLLKKSKT